MSDPDQAMLSVVTRVTSFIYTDCSGGYGLVRVEPVTAWYGSLKKHPAPQWFMRAVDLATDETHDFAMANMRDVQVGDIAAQHDSRSVAVAINNSHKIGAV